MPSDAPATLESFLGRYYAAKVMSAEPPAKVLADFATALADDAALRPAAERRKQELAGPASSGRCFISSVSLDFLTLALGGQG